MRLSTACMELPIGSYSNIKTCKANYLTGFKSHTHEDISGVWVIGSPPSFMGYVLVTDAGTGIYYGNINGNPQIRGPSIPGAGGPSYSFSRVYAYLKL